MLGTPEQIEADPQAPGLAPLRRSVVREKMATPNFVRQFLVILASSYQDRSRA